MEEEIENVHDDIADHLVRKYWMHDVEAWIEEYHWSAGDTLESVEAKWKAQLARDSKFV
jgi:hypothetical protein